MAISFFAALYQAAGHQQVTDCTNILVPDLSVESMRSSVKKIAKEEKDA
jgi:hypothetical protein